MTTSLQLTEPFIIGPTLSVAVRIADAHETAFLCLSNLESAEFTLILPKGEHVIRDYLPGAGFNRNTGDGIQRMFTDVLGFMSACGESYRYCMSKVTADKPMSECLADSENGGLFPEHVAEFCYRFSDEIQMLCLTIEDAEQPLISVMSWYKEHIEDIGPGMRVAATPQQVASLNRVCDRYQKRPLRLSLTTKMHDHQVHPDTLFAHFENILIGIETDGYAHS